MKQPQSSGATTSHLSTTAADTDIEVVASDDATTTSSTDQAPPLLDKAKQLFTQASQPVKDASSKAVTGFNKLSTTQKVVGGGLLLFLGARLLTGDGKKGKGKNKQADTLHELLLFVNDRVEGYRKAATESQDPGLKSYYQQLASQSQKFANDLNGYLTRLGDQRETGTTLKGKLYRRLMEATAAVTGHDEKAILATNIHGEQWAIAAYEDALSDGTLKGPVHRAVARQHAYSKQTYQELKELESQQTAS